MSRKDSDYMSYDEKVAMSLLRSQRANGENEREAQYRESDARYQRKTARKWLLLLLLGVPAASLVHSLALCLFGFWPRFLTYAIYIMPLWLVRRHNVCIDAYRVAARKNLPFIIEIAISLFLYVFAFVYSIFSAATAAVAIGALFGINL